MNPLILGPLALDIIARAAPALGGILAGDRGKAAGALVGDLIAGQLGVPATPDALEDAARKSPEAFTQAVQIVEERNYAEILAAWSQILAGERQSGDWLVRNARPITVLACLAMIAALFVTALVSPDRAMCVVEALAAVPLAMWGLVTGLPATWFTQRHIEKKAGAA
jgi:hypothetical protein